MKKSKAGFTRAAPCPEPINLEHVPGVGFRVRLRYGKKHRDRFLIKNTDPNVAQSRANRMRDVATVLAATGHSADAPLVLKAAGEATTDREFEEILAVAEKPDLPWVLRQTEREVRHGCGGNVQLSQQSRN